MNLCTNSLWLVVLLLQWGHGRGLDTRNHPQLSSDENYREAKLGPNTAFRHRAFAKDVWSRPHHTDRQAESQRQNRFDSYRPHEKSPPITRVQYSVESKTLPISRTLTSESFNPGYIWKRPKVTSTPKRNQGVNFLPRRHHKHCRRVGDDVYVKSIVQWDADATFSFADCDQIPCACFFKKKKLYMSCKHKEFDEFPGDFPSNVYSLDMSYNKIRELRFSSIARYMDLQILIISHNRLQTLMGFYRHMRGPPLRVLDLQYNEISNLKGVNLGGFNLLTNVSLSHNRIMNISNLVFDGLYNLLSLDLSYNNISKIDETAFDSLYHLLELRLDHNKHLPSDDRMNKRVFKYLACLRKLSLEGNSRHGNLTSYPNQIWPTLQKLYELTIDGLSGTARIHPANGKPTKIEILVIGRFGYCGIKNISSDFFQFTPYLKTLMFYGCRFSKINPDAFRSIRLHKYIVAFPKGGYRFTTAFDDLQYMQSMPITKLGFIGFLNREHCHYLDETEGKYLKTINLTALYLDFNYLSVMTKAFINHIPRTLQNVHLRGNKFSVIGDTWKYLVNFTSILAADVRDQNVYSSSPQDNAWAEVTHQHGQLELTDESDSTLDLGAVQQEFPYGNPLRTEIDLPRDVASVCDQQSQICERPYDYPYGNRERNTVEAFKTPDNEERQCNPEDDHDACIPPNMRVIRASGFTEIAQSILSGRRSRNSLCYLDFSRAFITEWAQGSLPKSVKIADLSENFCNSIHRGFFRNNDVLEYLCLESNYLGLPFANDVNGTIFRNLTKLKYLNIAMNNIISLPPSIFNGLHSLQILILRANRLKTLDLDISSMQHLKFIDIRNNALTWISENTRQQLDQLASDHVIFIDLTGNPLPCTCNGIQLLQWMSRTRVHFRYRTLLQCNDKTRLGSLTDRIHHLMEDCVPYSGIIVANCVCCFIFLLIVVFGLLYRNRWKLIYRKNAWLFNSHGFRPQGQSPSQRLYDAYVVYTEEDRNFALDKMIEELETKRKHRLCVQDRDFIPGTFYFSNIPCAIHNSTCTLLLLSPDFLSNKEMEYAIQMALMEERSGQHKRDVILLLTYKEISNEALSEDLLKLMQQGRYLEYPTQQRDHAIENGFWDRLSHMIGHAHDMNGGR